MKIELSSARVRRIRPPAGNTACARTTPRTSPADRNATPDPARTRPSGIFLLRSLAGIAAVLLKGLAVMASPASASTADPGSDPRGDDSGINWDRWSFQFGTAIVMTNVIDDFAFGRYNRASGPAGGEIYLFQASYTIRDLSWNIAGRTFEPQLELPVVFGIANENERSPFFDTKVGVTIRWKDFPWNSWLYTNLESGSGLSYTERIYAIEEVRHPGRSRSHFKFYLPIQLTLAHPHHRQHQAVFFLHHHSGGRIFEKGGTNALGLGYRYVFRER